MKISDVMTREVETIGPDQTAREAAAFMLSADTGSIPVTEGDKLIGMITDRDIAVRGIAKGHGPDTLVRDLMTSGLICARSDDNIADIAAKMSDAQVRRLPVIDDAEQLIGIVSRRRNRPGSAQGCQRARWRSPAVRVWHRPSSGGRTRRLAARDLGDGLVDDLLVGRRIVAIGD